MNRREDRLLSELTVLDVIACAAWWEDTRPSWMVSRAVSKWLEHNGFLIGTDETASSQLETFTAEVARERFGHHEPRERRP